MSKKKPLIVFSLASANKIQTCKLYLPTEDSWFVAMVVMLKFIKFSQNSAEQVNIIIARKKDKIYKYIRRSRERFIRIKRCLLLNNYFHWSTKIYCFSLPTSSQSIYSCISKPEQPVRSDHHCCTSQKMLPGYAYSKTMPVLSFQWLT